MPKWHFEPKLSAKNSGTSKRKPRCQCPSRRNPRGHSTVISVAALLIKRSCTSYHQASRTSCSPCAMFGGASSGSGGSPAPWPQAPPNFQGASGAADTGGELWGFEEHLPGPQGPRGEPGHPPNSAPGGDVGGPHPPRPPSGHEI